MATLAIGLTIPLSILADVVWKHKSYEPLFVIGALPMFCSFFVIAILTHLDDWDPLMDFVKYAGRFCRNKCSRSRISGQNPGPEESRHQEQESLISDGDPSSQDDEPSL